MGQSWFYLTLWRGTPPEFTNTVEAVIGTNSIAAAAIRANDSAGAVVDTASSAPALVRKADSVASEINQSTEVIWRVGRKNN